MTPYETFMKTLSFYDASSSLAYRIPFHVSAWTAFKEKMSGNSME